jgi:hypothetical protein
MRFGESEEKSRAGFAKLLFRVTSQECWGIRAIHCDRLEQATRRATLRAMGSSCGALDLRTVAHAQRPMETKLQKTAASRE